jgi:hypothetical protein
MKTLYALSMVVVMASAGLGAPGIAGTHQYKGYLNVGTYVVTLPQQLEPGDRIAITRVNGTRVLDQRVTNGYFVLDVSKLRAGVYVVSVRRNGLVIAAIRVPYSPGSSA